ncbi:unnamed protein product [Lymnaea stagnalis]|uniref:Uncharacterized protein n=1 Tax=Lymnaea stagnalis TaxID=6523 RepID=A0AAV2HZ01_LYMST
MEYLLQRDGSHLRRAHLISIVLYIVAAANTAAVNDEPSNRVSIEEFIDLDEASAPFQTPSSPVGNEVKNTISKGRGFIKADVPAKVKNAEVVFDDDDDLFASGSGSGSGFDDVNIHGKDANGKLTPTEATSSPSTTSPSTSTEVFEIKEGGADHVINITGDQPHVILHDEQPATADNSDSNENVMISKRNGSPARDVTVMDQTFMDSDSDNDSDDVVDDTDSIYDLPSVSEVSSNQIITPASWGKWSDWFVAGVTSKVRVRTCQLDGRETSDVACDGIRVQIKSCENAHLDRCGQVQNISTVTDEGCGQPLSSASKDNFLKGNNAIAAGHSLAADVTTAPPPPPPAPKAPPTLAEKPNPDVCQYSLYDSYRQKYVFTRWNLTELITKSKVKRWCDRKSGQYLVMTTPQEHCRRYYKDLCKVSERCHTNKPTKEKGDFAEGCWRNLVYGEMLPVGLSPKRNAIYLICQRFAAQSKMGKLFGYKDTHYATLYDTTMRSPVLALNKITRLGDETWPETDYFIEHGLVENESNMLWLFRKPRKGMLSLVDLDRCHDDQSCDVGLRQILPQDFHDQRETGYTPTHLMWPELMPADPSPRVSTFTLTNMAPLVTDLFQEWHNTVKKVRQFAIDHCGIPVTLDLNLRHPGELSSHRTNKSALYLASGILPNSGPIVTTGHGIQVPFMFWMAGCCVQQHVNIDTPHEENSTDINWNETVYEDEKVNITAFAVYIRNVPDNHVIPAPVLQLEMLLQDMYKATATDVDISLFPGHDSTCSDLKNDISRWFQ